MKIYTYLFITLFSLSLNSYAQDAYDKNAFVLGLNNAIKSDIKGVTVKRLNFYPSTPSFYICRV